MSEEKKSEGGNPQRWWESYLVRYFLGSVVGMICIIVLVVQVDSDISDFLRQAAAPSNEKAVNFVPLAVGLILFGLAYCYIASSPITVLHSARMLPNALGRLSRAFWLGWVLNLVLSMSHLLSDVKRLEYSGHLIGGAIVFIAVITFIAMRDGIFKAKEYGHVATLAANTFLFAALLTCITELWGNTPQQAILLAFSWPVIWILLTQYLTLFHLFVHTHIKWQNSTDSKGKFPVYPIKGRYFDFYRQITKARLTKNSRDIRDSYTHLREHSNSVFVVLIELNILAGLLFLHSIQPVWEPHVNLPTNIPIFWTLALVLLGIWLVPTMFMWSLANRLELVFSLAPEEFVGSKNTSFDQDL